MARILRGRRDCLTEFFIVWTAVSDLGAVGVTVTGGLGRSLITGEELSGEESGGGERLTAISAGVLRLAGGVEVVTAISQETTLGVTVTVVSLAGLLSTPTTAGLRCLACLACLALLGEVRTAVSHLLTAGVTVTVQAGSSAQANTAPTPPRARHARGGRGG